MGAAISGFPLFSLSRIFNFGESSVCYPNYAFLLGQSDYLPVTTSLTFSPGETLMIVPVDTVGDNVNEGMEEFLGVLSNIMPARGTRIGMETATVIISGKLLISISSSYARTGF